MGLTKICSLEKRNLDDKIPILLWAYRKTYNRLIGQTHFKLLYGYEAINPLHFKDDSNRIKKVLKFYITQRREDQLD